MSQLNLKDVAALIVKSNRKGLTIVLSNKKENECAVLHEGKLAFLSYSLLPFVKERLLDGDNTGIAYLIPASIASIAECNGEDVMYTLEGEYQL
jgi:hypothetical protein